ncbi:MAG: hypothetical protein IT334_06165 [Thermomicrobiales bacterium]|nr:hypothetical protein [Thermomicrobiales bacterium]
MQQRPTRFYITQEEDQTVVRSVPMSRRVRALLPVEERHPDTEPETTNGSTRNRSVTQRLKAVVKRT